MFFFAFFLPLTFASLPSLASAFSASAPGAPGAAAPGGGVAASLFSFSAIDLPTWRLAHRLDGLLRRDGATRALPRARVRLRPLAADRQTLLVPHAAVGL